MSPSARTAIRILGTLAVSALIWWSLACPGQGILREVRAFGRHGRWSGFGWCALQIGSLVPHVLGSVAGMLALPLWLWHWRFVRKARQTLTNPV